ncbi:MAG: LysR family transcriptional regulator [Gammaproteobacteria bacterium]|nr:LysR family transcriptional regulator [Gammaproteobacteria bacterium]MBU0785499.1 LysR family transcriptional regulator [Gammaproteobacteria bacterium]MBU0813699.1 LysR family transcriptional regulator [Gammaproteobacteria bacterium]MBU1788829.1 LysR family transcriptional regulator [Gammaproteobacteria bacterium]
MHIKDIDLNLLRVFDAVYRARNVSRAADMLDLTQPAVSQGLTRLRLLVKDPLFMRASGGVQPSPRAEQLAPAVRLALGMLEQALSEAVEFDPLQSSKTFRIHMSDIGEGRFLPDLMVALRQHAPGIRIETAPLPAAAITDALDSGRTDFAFGFLPTVTDTQSVELLKDRYIVLLREGHPFAAEFNRMGKGPAMLEKLRELEFVAGRTHSDTLRILQLLQLEDRVRLTAEHFMVLPAIVRATDLGVVMPRNIAQTFSQAGGYAIIEPPFPLRDFTVSLHWSKRFESDPGNRWLRQLLVELFAVR